MVDHFKLFNKPWFVVIGKNSDDFTLPLLSEKYQMNELEWVIERFLF